MLAHSLVMFGALGVAGARASEPAGPRVPQLQEVAAVVAPATLEAPVQVRVVLDVDAQGRVLAARVVQTGGEEVDAAVLVVARALKLTPATDEAGVPVPATLELTFDVLPEVREAVSLEGRVLEAGVRRPWAGLVVQAQSGDRVQRVVADDLGRFSFAALAPGRWVLQTDDVGVESWPVEVEVGEGEVAQVKLFVRRAGGGRTDAVEEVEVVSRRLPEVSARPVRAATVRILPGSFGDPVRAVKNLPGVARSPFGLGALIIRGKAAEDARYSIDGLDVPLAFHFGGLTTVLNADHLEEVSFLPGNYGVRYGRNLGGRVDLRTKEVLPEGVHGHVSLDLFQVAGFVEIPVSKRTSITLALRRSYIDSVLTPVLSSGGQAIQAPRYWDAQMRLLHHAPDGAMVDASILVSDDRFATLDPGTGETDLGYGASFVKGRVRWRAPLQGGWRHELALQVGPDSQDADLGSGNEAFERRTAIELRDEVTLPADEGLGWRIGFDLAASASAYRYDVASFGPAEEGEAFVTAPALYVEPTWTRGPITLVAGVRANLFSVGGQRPLWSFDPRGSLSVEVSPTTTARVTLGRYTTTPTLRQLLPPVLGDGNPTLTAPWSLQASLGLDQRFAGGWTLGTTFFYDELHDLVVGREERFRFFQVPWTASEYDIGAYGNEGTGRTFGLEVMATLTTDRWVAWLSGTFSRSERTRRGREEAELFEYDQSVVVNALASYALPRGWRLGGRVRVSMGNPYTPVVNKVYDLNARRFIPLLGEPMSARLDAFWALDVRVDKTWVFRRWSLSLYLDIQNVTNTQTLEFWSYREDFTDLEGIVGLPVLPVFGLKGAW